MSLREIGAQYGVTEKAIRKRAKKLDWVRKGSMQVRKNGTQKKLCTMYAQNSTKIPMPQIDSNCPPPENTADGWTLNPDKYGLNDMQARFVSEYLIDMSRVL